MKKINMGGTMPSHVEIDKMELAFEHLIGPLIDTLEERIDEYELHHFQAFSTSNIWSESYYKGKLDAYKEILRAVEGE